MVYQTLQEFTDGKEVTYHNIEKKHSHNNYFTAISLFDIPTEQESLKSVSV
jgi:hypothetical protein